jgi:pimeloyl-ACP methyl ester carboxylesterase
MGQGTATVVFVHGLVLDNHTSFYLSIAPMLAKHARLILYDLRGHGLSDQPPTGYGADSMAHDIAALLDSLGLTDERVFIVGHSFGGHVGLRFAALYPQRLRGLVLLDAHSGVAELGENMAGTLTLEGEARDDKVRELFGNWLAKHEARGHFDRDGEATVALVERLRARRRSPMVTTAESLIYETSFVHDISSTRPMEDEELREIDCPVLALYGADSDLRSDGERLAQLLPNSHLELFDGCAHGVLWQARDKVVTDIESWLLSAMK